MTISELDAWFRSFLDIPGFEGKDDSLNGIQVSRSDTPVRRVAFAVDACARSIARAAGAGAQVLFVHHGMFWGKSERLTGAMLGRVKALVEADMALYACHLPLDSHPGLGNNAVLARMLGLTGLRPFGTFRGMAIGCAGVLEPPVTLDEALLRILPDRSPPRSLIAAGPVRISSAAIVSGGAAFEALEAIGERVDLYVTGEPSHSIYHHVQEGGINFIAAGHYATEVWGVQAVRARLEEETGLDTLFIDLPTGL